MDRQHKQLANGRWYNLSLTTQMANIGSEVFRASKWQKEGNHEYSKLAIDRALELLDLTISDSRHSKRLKEIVRLREFLVDYFFGTNQYHSTEEYWNSYFFAFNYAARI
jgi:hypothetical protein